MAGEGNETPNDTEEWLRAGEGNETLKEKEEWLRAGEGNETLKETEEWLRAGEGNETLKETEEWLRAGEGNETIKRHSGNAQKETIRDRADNHMDRKGRETEDTKDRDFKIKQETRHNISIGGSACHDPGVSRRVNKQVGTGRYSEEVRGEEFNPGAKSLIKLDEWSLPQAEFLQCVGNAAYRMPPSKSVPRQKPKGPGSVEDGRDLTSSSISLREKRQHETSSVEPLSLQSLWWCGPEKRGPVTLDSAAPASHSPPIVSLGPQVPEGDIICTSGCQPQHPKPPDSLNHEGSDGEVPELPWENSAWCSILAPMQLGLPDVEPPVEKGTLISCYKAEKNPENKLLTQYLPHRSCGEPGGVLSSLTNVGQIACRRTMGEHLDLGHAFPKKKEQLPDLFSGRILTAVSRPSPTGCKKSVVSPPRPDPRRRVSAVSNRKSAPSSSRSATPASSPGRSLCNQALFLIAEFLQCMKRN
ncbi:hypothetical protein EYF80_026354 [Liparis tanakae]|uniref:Uncharacterized protein n=1 Tax=Liparis tanakae TaxID=230148 RepID=A0A4Z2HC06_9TELE|nr:hypothetical protein EYF80_026354 [Liparis tanakae]